MKKLFGIIFLFLFIETKSFSQDYTLDSTRIHAQANRGEFFLASLLITNNTSNILTFQFDRIVKNLPANWTSCFCFPTCIAPWIDTLTFSIPPFGTDSIKPNFGTDSIPGVGYITVVLLIQDPESSFSVVDTIHFTGSTLNTGISDVKERKVDMSVYPNPVTDGLLNIHIDTENVKIEYSITNLLGQELIHNAAVVFNNSFQVDMSVFDAGTYFLKIVSVKGQFVSKIVKQ